MWVVERIELRAGGAGDFYSRVAERLEELDQTHEIISVQMDSNQIASFVIVARRRLSAYDA